MRPPVGLDVSFVRSRFPAFSQPDLKGLAFFENAGGSYPCGAVVERLTRFYASRKMQPYGPATASQLGGAEMDEARNRLAMLLGVDADEVSFGPSTTQNVYVLAQAFGEWMGPGDAIVVTDQDHEANSGPWRRLAGRGIEVREWRLDPETGHLDPAELAQLLDERVRLVAFPHCSNVVAEINDVASIVSMIHDAGAAACVDGVSYAPHGLPNVSKLKADIYLFSTYKTYGPHQGVMVIRRALSERLPAQGHWFNSQTPTKRFTPAGPDHAQVAASAGIADYIDELYRHHGLPEAAPAERCAVVHDLMRDHEIRLLQPLLDYLDGRNDLRLLGPRRAEARAPTVAVHLDRPGRELAEALAGHGIACDGGDFYARRPLMAMGIDPEPGVLRMSFVHYTSGADVERLMVALDKVL
ncbi:MAG: aminotransferase class V-fold PLP-dependent enzyme [Pseudomonadota bacterium]